MRIFESANIDFISKRKTAYIISGTLLILGLISLVLRGLELGIDFKGGSDITLQFENPIEISAIRSHLTDIGLGNVEVKTYGGDNGVLVKTELQEIPRELFPRIIASIEAQIEKSHPGVERTLTDSTINSVTYSFENPSIANKVIESLFKTGFQTGKATMEPTNREMVVRVSVADWVEEILREKMPDNKFEVQKEETVGPKIGGELKLDAIISVVLALIVILVYLGFRFKFAFALGAVAALFHDVMITLGVFSLLYGLLPLLNLEISINVVAAFLTLVGYSINDTVVVYDRVRENMKVHKTAPIKDNINFGINKTLPRTIITSVTTLFTVTVLLIFGGQVLRDFAFTLFFGILIGTYSSIFVASPFVYEYATRWNKKIEF